MSDATSMHVIINEAAKAYDGVIPSDCYYQPYMPEEELEKEMKRVTFYGWEEANGELVGVMGIEPIKDVTLIGNGPEVLGKVEMVSNDWRLTYGGSTCGKEGQMVPVGAGQPTVKISSITVGGRKA